MREGAVARTEALERSEQRGGEIPPNRHERLRCLIVITKVFAAQSGYVLNPDFRRRTCGKKKATEDLVHVWTL